MSKLSPSQVAGFWVGVVYGVARQLVLEVAARAMTSAISASPDLKELMQRKCYQRAVHELRRSQPDLFEARVIQHAAYSTRPHGFTGFSGGQFDLVELGKREVN